jgi:hypothetical protein
MGGNRVPREEARDTFKRRGPGSRRKTGLGAVTVVPILERISGHTIRSLASVWDLLRRSHPVDGSNLTVSVLSSPRVCRDYQCLYDEFEGFKGVSRHAAYVIDREGTIRYSYICPDPRDLPDFEKIKQCLREIK